MQIHSAIKLIMFIHNVFCIVMPLYTMYPIDIRQCLQNKGNPFIVQDCSDLTIKTKKVTDTVKVLMSLMNLQEIPTGSTRQTGNLLNSLPRRFPLNAERAKGILTFFKNVNFNTTQITNSANFIFVIGGNPLINAYVIKALSLLYEYHSNTLPFKIYACTVNRNTTPRLTLENSAILHTKLLNALHGTKNISFFEPGEQSPTNDQESFECILKKGPWTSTLKNTVFNWIRAQDCQPVNKFGGAMRNFLNRVHQECCSSPNKSIAILSYYGVEDHTLLKNISTDVDRKLTCNDYITIEYDLALENACGRHNYHIVRDQINSFIAAFNSYKPKYVNHAYQW